MATKIIEHSQVFPSSGTPAAQLLPLLHFDMWFLLCPPLQNAIFYEFPCSKSYFLDSIIPDLKNSLSLALKYFPPLVGKIVFPLTSDVPISHYVAGDSISFIVAESSVGLVDMMGNYPKPEEQFFELVPNELPPIYLPDSIKIPGFAARVTLFHDQGISIGYSLHHSACDFVGITSFLRLWALIARSKGDTFLSKSPEKYLPFYGRDVPGSDKLTKKYWNIVKQYGPTIPSTIVIPTGNVQCVFLLTEDQMKKLKKFAMSHKKKQTITYVSTYAAICAHVWTCFARAAVAIKEEVADDEPEYLVIPVNCRTHLNPPLPDSYFGNCLELVTVKSTHGKLKRFDGIITASELIGEAIHKTLNDKMGILNDSESRFTELMNIQEKGRVARLGGSPNIDHWSLDFGWGKPKRFSTVHKNFIGTISILKSAETNGIEISFSIARNKMDAFAVAFNGGLRDARL